MTKINTYYGHTIDYNHPDPKEIDIRDIAHNLSFENRFIGKTEKPYSVAQHCVLGSYLFEKMGMPEFALQFLLHDAAEAYVKDIPTPLKRLLGEAYLTIETAFHHAIWTRFNLAPLAKEAIKAMDLLMLAAEKEQLLRSGNVPWTQLDGIKPPDIHIVPWQPPQAEREYLAQFKKLTTLLENEPWQE